MEIRPKDIAYVLGFSRASVSRMMDVLKDEGCIIKEKYGTLTLTESGRNAAVFIKKRHDLIKSFLIDVLGVEAAIADKDACRMEHTISSETFEKLNQQLENLSETQAVQRTSWFGIQAKALLNQIAVQYSYLVYWQSIRNKIQKWQ